MDMFIVLIAVMVSWVYMYVKTYSFIHFEYMQFIVCKLYVNEFFLKVAVSSNEKSTSSMCSATWKSSIEGDLLSRFSQDVGGSWNARLSILKPE